MPLSHFWGFNRWNICSELPPGLGRSQLPCLCSAGGLWLPCAVASAFSHQEPEKRAFPTPMSLLSVLELHRYYSTCQQVCPDSAILVGPPEVGLETTRSQESLKAWVLSLYTGHVPSQNLQHPTSMFHLCPAKLPMEMQWWDSISFLLHYVFIQNNFWNILFQILLNIWMWYFIS